MSTANLAALLDTQAPIAFPRLDELTQDKAMELCTKSPEMASRLLMAIIANNTGELPDTTFVKRGDGQLLKKYRRSVRLSERDGMLIPMGGKTVDGKWVSNWDTSISGLRKLNEVPAILVIRPEHVIVDGREQMNPYIAVNEASRMPEVVYARCLAVGYSPHGSLVATDVMVRLDINLYLLENINAKMKKLAAQNPLTAAALGEFGSSDAPPTIDEGKNQGKPRPGRWKFMPIHSVGDIGLWINLASPMFQEIIGDHATRLKFVERLAQSFSERNALKAHPAIPKVLHVVNGVAIVPMVGWTTDFDHGDIDRLRKLAESGRIGEFKDRRGASIDTVAVPIDDESTREAAEVLNDVAAAEARNENVATGRRDDEAEKQEAKVAAQPEDLLPKAIEAFGRLCAMLTVRKANEIKKSAGIDILEEGSPEELALFLVGAQEAMAAAEKKK